MSDRTEERKYRRWLIPLTFLGLLAALVLLIVLAIRWWNHTEIEVAEGPLGFTAAELAAAYDTDPMATRARLEGRTILLRGRFSRATSILSGDPLIQLDTENPLLQLSASVDQVHSPWVQSLQPSNVITLSCTAIRSGVTAPILENCRPLSPKPAQSPQRQGDTQER